MSANMLSLQEPPLMTSAREGLERRKREEEEVVEEEEEEKELEESDEEVVVQNGDEQGQVHPYAYQQQRQHQLQHRPSLSALSETSSVASFPSLADHHPQYPQHHHRPSLPFESPPQTPSVSGSRRNAKGLILSGTRTSISPGTPIRRKPLSSSASSIATRYSTGEYLATVVKDLPHPEQRYDRSFSVDSPIVYDFPQGQDESMSSSPRRDSVTEPLQPTRPGTTDAGTTDATDTADIADTDVSPYHEGDKGKSPDYHHHNHPLALAPGAAQPAIFTAETKRPDLGDVHPAGLDPAAPHSDQQTTPYDDLLVGAGEGPLSDNLSDGYNSDSSENINSNSVNNNMSLRAPRKAAPQHLTLKSDQPSLIRTNSNELKTPNTDKPLPKSPGTSRFGFGWGASPTTDRSEQAYSPIPSPFNFSKSGSIPDASPITTVGPQSSFETGKTQFGRPLSHNYRQSYQDTPTIGPLDSADIEEMEDELKAISVELAASIRRELDLEDMVEKLQAEKDNPTAMGSKRTSDYFSDSGYSSAKFSEYDQSRDEVEKIQRRSDQERAQLRLELTVKLQDERNKRQLMDEQIKDLSAKASQIDLTAINNADASERVKELEATCESLRRKLTEEREMKDNFEDLLSALKGELQDASDERDNLRGEIIPELQAQVENLQDQANEFQKMTSESAKMRQELNLLRNENSTLRQVQMSSISEEGGTTSAPLSRSNSVGGAARRSYILPRPPSVILKPKIGPLPESANQLSERIKDVEEQRDALHRALKNLLIKQEHQERENEKKIRALEIERDRLLTSSPQKAGFQREINHLKAEITVLRRRADEALDQKWLVEKGLSGLKMDLDKAEQEVESLRKLLRDKDILIPPAFARLSSSSDQFTAPVTSESLIEAYEDLQKAYTDSVQRIKNREDGVLADESTQTALKRLEAVLCAAVSERDLAQSEVETLKERLASLQASEQSYLASEMALADELQESARRVEELAIQVQRQLVVNQQLRKRIADTVTRGDASRTANVDQITSTQARLRILEEKLEAAQTLSEDRVARHEEEVLSLKESHSTQLTRLRDNLRSPRTFPAKSPISPLFSRPGGPSPRLDVTRSGPAMNVSEETQIDNLKARVAELENALADADAEMQQVVGRMSIAQMEVLQLQEEREAAINQTRKLEREMQAEKVKAFEERFKTLQS